MVSAIHIFYQITANVWHKPADPDLVRQSPRFGQARLFSRWFAEVRGGKHLVVVVLSQGTESLRNWVVTAYLARRLAEGDLLWQRN